VWRNTSLWSCDVSEEVGLSVGWWLKNNISREVENGKTQFSER
jgi:hypothetical protein